jgi:hypothetical protein
MKKSIAMQEDKRQGLPGLQFLDRCTALLKKDAMTAVRAPDIDVDLDLLFAPCALV